MRSLMPVAEKLVGSKAQIRWNESTDGPPEPWNLSCAVIVSTIGGSPSAPPQTAILNVIKRAHREPKPDDLYEIIGAQFFASDLA